MTNRANQNWPASEVITITKYPPIYHAAVNHLVSFGGHNRADIGRRLVAGTLRALRASFGREFARNERRHLVYIAGHLPIKPARIVRGSSAHRA